MEQRDRECGIKRLMEEYCCCRRKEETARYYLSGWDPHGNVNLVVEKTSEYGGKSYVTITIPFGELRRLVDQYPTSS